jgi:hypothetical protein
MNRIHRAPPTIGHAASAILRFLVLVIVVSSVHAQTATKDPLANSNATIADPSAPSAAQAPDDMTRKITDLVNAGKYAEAQALTTGLLAAYPDDQRLIRAKALIQKLLSPGSSANPAPENSQPAQPAANSGVEELTGIDKVDYNALIELAHEVQQSTDLTEQANLLKQFMEQSNSFLQKHPDQMLVWQLRAASAISLNEPMTGYEAGQRLLASGAADSNDSNLQRLLGQLRNKGWLDRQKAEELQRTVDKARQQEQEAEERVQNTFPVVHAKVGFGANGYGYGHLIINKDSAVYEGTDENIRLAVSEIREVKVACNVDACGMYFTPRSGRKFFFLSVTEEAVANRTDKGQIFHKPAVLGNAVVSRWGFVKIDEKTLGPPPAASVPTPKAEASAVRVPPPASKPTPELTAQAAETPGPMNGSMPQAAPQVSQGSVGASNPAPVRTAAASVSDTAILHLYRLHQFSGLGLKTNIDIDGKKATQIANGQAIRMLVAPGKHNITASARKAKADLPIYDLVMEPGKEYWVRVDFSAKLLNYVRLYLEPVEKAQSESGKLEEISLGDLSINTSPK